ncbi:MULTISPECIES: alanine/ornithine racemase family PLP-dependent enzyme [Sporomusa]|jgi:predicted amino acid racemase|uniref:alanine/ornithine racemase family PLP-dependent enzyme n=1 Tax=Sporomusa TaxID=2375 RepID=UPI001668B0DA|nr:MULTISPECIES: alanine/ornithine racemase family PLP-dependent enzyme [Sporomusa]MCM0760612.1 alanine/ornithine racemase family PLP-dependent enzyme [Sporomusa sphaeroides DSM 2875]HML31872.1 alanine/ornithine racemase family PLP-dependent enzyme [Sporomusa sphaeroides]
MSFSSRLEIDLDKIKYNAAKVVEVCHKHGIEVLGVTKGFSAIPQIVTAVLEGGVDGLADARMENIIELRHEGISAPITLLRIPRLSDVENVVKYSDVSINSEISVIRALGETAKAMGFRHQIILMVDVGDLREGIMIENVLAAVRAIVKVDGISLLGLGTNMGCFGGILPEYTNLNILVELAKLIKSRLGITLQILSGGGTSSLLLVEKGEIPAGINQLRVGEGMLLGTDTTNNRAIAWLKNDAFILKTEVIEAKLKPSVPRGNIGRDAFGNIPEFEDIGIRKKAIVALGKQDVYIEGLIPLDNNITILGASSDHMILDITDIERTVRVGDELAFGVTYSGLLSASQSRYIKKVFRKDNKWLN